MVAVVMPGAVIGEEDHPGILGEAKSVQGLQHATDGVIDFFDDIPIEPLFGMPIEGITDVEGNVGHVMREVEKEGMGLVTFDELDCTIGIEAGELTLVGHGFDDVCAIDKGKWRVGAGFGGGMVRPHVIGVGQAEIFIEAMGRWQELGGIAEVPFAEDSGAITAVAEQFGESELVGVDAGFGAWSERAVDADAIGVTTGEQGGAGGGADGLGDVETGEPRPFAGETIEMRGANFGGAVATEITPAEVIGEDQNDIGWARRVGGGEGEAERAGPEQESDAREQPERERRRAAGRG